MQGAHAWGRGSVGRRVKTCGAPVNQKGFSALPMCNLGRAIYVIELPRRLVPQSEPTELATADFCGLLLFLCFGVCGLGTSRTHLVLFLHTQRLHSP